MPGFGVDVDHLSAIGGRVLGLRDTLTGAAGALAGTGQGEAGQFRHHLVELLVPEVGFDPAPGDLGPVNDFVDALGTSRDRILEAHGAVSGLNAGDGWTGEAADGFQRDVGQVGTRLGAVHTAVHGTNRLLGQWSGELGSMQTQADQLETQAAQAQQQLRTAQSNPDLALAGQSFTDQASAQAAQQKFGVATRQVREAQGQLDDIREQGRQLYQQHQTLAHGYASAIRDQLSGQVDGDATLSGKVSGSTPLRGFTAAGSAEGSVGAKGSAGFTAGPDGMSAYAKGQAGASGSLSGSLTNRWGGISGSVDGFAGVDGTAELRGGKDGASLDLEGFAGARGEATATATMGPASVSDTVSGYAGAEAGVSGFVGEDGHGNTGFSVGVGASAGAGADAGVHAYEDSSGTYHVGFNASDAFGIEGDVGADISVNPDTVESTAKSIGSDIKQGAKDFVNGVESLF